MKVGIGVVDHHTLQIESPDEVADLVRLALQQVPADHLVIYSDCGMGREGMSRRHASYKMVSLVLGTNLVRKGLGLPEAECLAADPRYSLIRASYGRLIFSADTVCDCTSPIKLIQAIPSLSYSSVPHWDQIGAPCSRKSKHGTGAWKEQRSERLRRIKLPQQ
jgi:hypothetical protein